MNIVDEIFSRRGSGLGYNPHRFIELFGGKMVETLRHEPDALTFRDEYYYNTRINVLFRRVRVGGVGDFAYWKKMSE